MRLSDFWRMVDEEFGPGYGRLLVDSQVLGEIGHRTAAQGIEDGVPVRQVWVALCMEMDVPKDRWLGRDLPIREGAADD